jgi:hypothetical protein
MSTRFRFFSIPCLGIFSLLSILALGIFSSTTEGSVPVTHTQVASGSVTGNVFSYTQEYATRRTVIEEAKAFLSGVIATESVFTSIPLHSSDYPAWESSFSFTTNAWVAGSSEALGFHWTSAQLKQVMTSKNPNFATGTFLLSRIPGSLLLSAYPNHTSLFSSPAAGSPHTIDAAPQTLQHVLIVSSQRCHVFYVGAGGQIKASTWDTSGSPAVPINIGALTTSHGIGGTVIQDGATERLCITYVDGANNAQEVVLSDTVPPGIVDGPRPLGIANPPNHVAIFQNPRTKKLFLGYVESAPGAVKVFKTDFSMTADWTLVADDSVFAAPLADWNNSGEISFAGLQNFEGVVGLKNTDGSAYDCVRKPPNWTKNNSFGATFLPVVFPCRINERDAVGMLNYSGFTNFSFFYRYLDYPNEVKWKMSDSSLHIEGPPLPNTNVTVTAVYPELATNSCLVYSVNGSGGRISIDGATGVAAASGTMFTIAFDRSMMTASYSSWIGNQIRILDAADTVQPITHLPPGTASEVHFKLNNDLLFNTTYRVSIASDVVDSLGSQLWVPATMTFVTQKTDTPPSGYTGIGLFKDAGRTTAFQALESVIGTATVYARITGNDGATLTRDITTGTLSLPWNGTISFAVQETASNSGGIYDGELSLAGIPLYGFATPQPGAASSTLTWSTEGAVPLQASLTLHFPQWHAASSAVQTTSGNAPASGATAVLLDSPIQVHFSPAISSAAVTTTQINLTKSGTTVPATFTPSADGTSLLINPHVNLSPESTYTVSASYVTDGLRNHLGNPLFRSFSFDFSTQASQTPPLSVSAVQLFPDNTFNPLAALAVDADFLNNGTVFIEMTGIDGSALTTDSTIASGSNGGTAVLAETGVGTGIYRGSIALGGIGNGIRFIVGSLVTQTASRSLVITYPSASPVSPASGATNVPISTTIRLQGNEDLDGTSLTAATVRLRQGAAVISSTLAYNAGTREITLTPDAVLGFTTTYLVEVLGIKDLAGNANPTTFQYTFSTQSSTTPPTAISSLKVFSDSGYSVPIVTGGAAWPLQEVYVEILAGDLSPTTQDATSMLMTSTLGGSQTLSLLETAVNSGVFRRAVTLFSDDDQTIQISSIEDPTYFHNLVIPAFPAVSTLSPASGSADLPLDTVFILKTTKDVDPGTLSSASIRLADSSGILSPTLLLNTAREIQVSAPLATNSAVFLEVKTTLKDTDGLAFIPLNAQFQTRAASFDPPAFFDDFGYSQPIPSESKVSALKTIFVEITGTDLRTSTLETITAVFSDSLATTSFILSESPGGVFRGSFQVPNSPGKPLSVSLPIFPTSLSKLTINPDFQLEDINPADGSTWVRADIWPKWTFTLPVDKNTVNATNFIVREITSGNVVGGTLKMTVDEQQVYFQPFSFLTLLMDYEMLVASVVRDKNGKELGKNFRTTFRSQGPPGPPSPVTALKVFSDPGYSLPTTLTTDDGTLFIEALVNDVSATTIDATWVRIDSSDSRMRGVEIPLEETGKNTGVFRGQIKVWANGGSVITIVTRADSTFFKEIAVLKRPEVTRIAPASGSVDILLDQPFAVTFSRKMSGANLSGGVTAVTNSGNALPVSSVLSADGLVLTVSPAGSWATGSTHLITLRSPLQDTDGLVVATTTFRFAGRWESVQSFDLLSGIAPRTGQSVVQLGEAVPGPIQLIASTPKLFLSRTETRNAEITIGGQKEIISLQEIATGQFSGTHSLPEQRGSNGSARLLFGRSPEIRFVIAPIPVIMQINPASGAVNVPENSAVGAVISRPVVSSLASSALNMTVDGQETPIRYLPTDQYTTRPSWEPIRGFPVGASVLIGKTPLFDRFGQPVDIPAYQFLIGGQAGIQLYEDAGFAKLVSGDVFMSPRGFVEVALSAKPTTPETVLLRAAPQRAASGPVTLSLQPYLPLARRYRGELMFEDTRGIPSAAVPLVPGELLTLTSPSLPGVYRQVYYLIKGDSPPTAILGINLYKEKFYAQKVEGSIAQNTLFVEIEGEDRNWMVADSTRLQVFSSSDMKGFDLLLRESEAHSGRYRGIVNLSREESNSVLSRLKVKPGDTITLISGTDPRVKATIKWNPESKLTNLLAWPSPVRGKQVTFSFYLTYPVDVELFVFDTTGDEVHYAFTRGKEGENRIVWNLPRRLANGVYFFTLEVLREEELQMKQKKYRGKFAILR